MHRIRRDSWTRHQIQLWRNWHNPMLPPFSGGGEAFVEFLCTERKHVFFSEQPSCHNSQKSNRTPAVSCHYSSIHHPSSLVVADIWNSTQTQRLTSAENHRIRLAVLLSFYGFFFAEFSRLKSPSQMPFTAELRIHPFCIPLAESYPSVVCQRDVDVYAPIPVVVC